MIKLKPTSILKSKSVKKSFLTFSEAGSGLLFIILSLPIFLEILGAEKYGIYILIQSFSSFVKMFNLGGNFTFTKFISQYRGENNLNKIKEFTSTIFIFQIFISIIFLLLVYPLIDFIIINYFDQTSNFVLFKSIIFFAIPIFLIDLFEQNFNGLHKGYERFDRALKVSLVSKFIKYSVQIGVIIYSKSLLNVYIVTLFTSLVFFIVHCFLCKKWYGEISFFTLVKWNMLKEFFNFSLWVWLMSIVSLLTFQADKWIITGLYNLETLAYYSIGVSVYNNLHVLTSSSVSWIFPKISFKGISNEMKLAYNKSSLILTLMSVSITIFLLLFGDYIFELWLGLEKYQSVEKYIKLFICVLPVISTTIVPYYFLLGLGKIKKLFILGISTSIILILGLYILSSFFELEYIIFSFLITYFFMSFLYQYETIKELKLSNQWKNYVLLLIIGVLSSVLYINIIN
jgi:O-antigen/teichoic acid export membrane protein